MSDKNEKEREIEKIVRLLWLLDVEKLKNLYCMVLHM